MDLCFYVAVCSSTTASLAGECVTSPTHASVEGKVSSSLNPSGEDGDTHTHTVSVSTIAVGTGTGAIDVRL